MEMPTALAATASRTSEGHAAAYQIVHTSSTQPLIEFVRVAGARWGVEEIFQFAKNETRLDHYQVRRYDAWYRHITLSLLAAAFLVVTAYRERVRDKRAPSQDRTAWSPYPATRSAGSGRPRPDQSIPIATPTTGPTGGRGTRSEPAEATTSDNNSSTTLCGRRTNRLVAPLTMVLNWCRRATHLPGQDGDDATCGDI